MQVLYGILVQHFAKLAGQAPLPVAHLDALAAQLLDLTAEVPFYAATVARARLSRLQERLDAALSDSVSAPCCCRNLPLHACAQMFAAKYTRAHEFSLQPLHDLTQKSSKRSGEDLTSATSGPRNDEDHSCLHLSRSAMWLVPAGSSASASALPAMRTACMHKLMPWAEHRRESLRAPGPPRAASCC